MLNPQQGKAGRDNFYHPTGWGLVRIAAILVALLWLAGLLFPVDNATQAHVPYAKQIVGDSRLRPGIAPNNDSRGVLSSNELNGSNTTVSSVAWVGGSSTMLCKDDKGKKECRFLPSKVLDKIGEFCDDESLIVDIYIKPGMRVLDQYVFLQHALATKPKAVVVTINPYWAFNDFSLSRREDLFAGVLYRGVEDKATLFWSSLIGQPGDLAFAGIARFLPVVRDKWNYHRHISRFWQDKVPNIEGTAEQSRERKGKLRDQARKTKRKKIISTRTVRCAPECIDLRPEGSGYRLIHRMFKTIVESGVNAVVYEAPFNQKTLVHLTRNTEQDKTEEFAEFFQRQSAVLREIAREFESPNVTVITAQDWDLQGLEFKDAIHLSGMGSLPDEISRELAPMVCADLTTLDGGKK